MKILTINTYGYIYIYHILIVNYVYLLCFYFYVFCDIGLLAYLKYTKSMKSKIDKINCWYIRSCKV